MAECIHGLDVADCDICTPKKPPERPALKRVASTRAAPAARSLRSKADQRLHVVLTLEELADALAEEGLADPIYFHGPEELAWGERRRSPGALQQVVLVVSADAVRGLDVMPMQAVQLVAVANHAAQERVRDLLAMTEHRARVAVYPPWFQAPEG